jgi:GntR family transcriptional regulator
VSGRPTSARQLRELLVHRMASGRYPIGAQLPGVRELATEVGANRNTVAKVYGELARERLLQIVPGRGTFVLARVDADQGAEPYEQVRRLLDDAVARARLFGLGRDAVMRLMEDRISSIYDDGTPRLAFVECNPYDAELGASELSASLAFTVQPLLVSDLEAEDVLERLDVAATSFFHLAEVECLLEGRGVPVVGVYTLPDPDALLALARLAPGTRVGIVANNEASVERFSAQVRTYCRAEIRTLVNAGDAQVAELATWSDVLVSSLSCSRQVKANARDRPVITLAFHVDPQSVQYIRAHLLLPARQEVRV